MRSVKIISSGGVSNGSKIVDTETGQDIEGVEAVDISLKVGDIVKATIKFALVETEVEGKASYVMAHPKSGERKRVRAIIFDDGETVNLS